jgi:hypothetical protein
MSDGDCSTEKFSLVPVDRDELLCVLKENITCFLYTYPLLMVSALQ